MTPGDQAGSQLIRGENNLGADLTGVVRPGGGEATIRALLLGPSAGGPMQRRGQIQLIAGVGIEGDRYAERTGTLGKAGNRKGLALTLIEEEGIEDVRREHGIPLPFETTRRNVVTSGIRLEDLLGKEFALGSAVARGVALNPPCSRLERLAGIRGLKRMMTGRGGIRADIIQTGVVKVEDSLTLL